MIPTQSEPMRAQAAQAQYESQPHHQFVWSRKIALNT